jgi:hypothetical protein
VTRLGKMMLEELQRRNYSTITRAFRTASSASIFSPVRL